MHEFSERTTHCTVQSKPTEYGSIAALSLLACFNFVQAKNVVNPMHYAYAPYKTWILITRTNARFIHRFMYACYTFPYPDLDVLRGCILAKESPPTALKTPIERIAARVCTLCSAARFFSSHTISLGVWLRCVRLRPYRANSGIWRVCVALFSQWKCGHTAAVCKSMKQFNSTRWDKNERTENLHTCERTESGWGLVPSIGFLFRFRSLSNGWIIQCTHVYLALYGSMHNILRNLPHDII